MSAMRFSASRCRAVRAGPPAPRGRGPERREWRERAERERPSEGGGPAERPAVAACVTLRVCQRVWRVYRGSGVTYGLRWDAVSGSRDVREIKSCGSRARGGSSGSPAGLRAVRSAGWGHV